MSDTEKPETADRLAKVMARAGLCSRRDAEGWITAGRVTVNGKKVLTPAFNVTSRDKIVVDGEQLAARQGTRIWLYHKPAGLVVTERDPEGRKTIFEALLEEGLPRVVTVGRLDINTEGLLLLTNDGGLKRVLELPSTGWLRRYRVRAYGHVTQAQLDALKDGIEVDGITYGPIEATLERAQGHNVWLVLGLREGKNREVKNVLGALGLEVNRLIRVSYGPFQLGDLAEGAVEVVRAKMLRDQLGKKLAEAAGVDFDSEMPDMPPRPREDERAPRGGKPGFGGGRDTGRPARPRRVHFDEDGRAPEEYEPKGPGRVRRDRDDQPASSFGKRVERGPRPDRGNAKSFGDRPRPPRRDDERSERPARSYGDRPDRGGSDRPQRGFGDKPARSFGGRPDRGGSDRPQRGFGDKPARSFGGRPDRGGNDRPQRSFGDKPARSFADRPARNFDDKGPRGPRSDRPQRAFENKGSPRNERPGQGRPGADRKPFAGKPAGAGRPFDGKPRGDRPFGAKPTGGRPSAGGRPSTGQRPGGGARPTGGGGRPTGGPRPTGGARPTGGPRPTGGSRPGAPRKPRG